MDTLDKISLLLANQKRTQKDLTDFLGLKKTAFTQWKSGKNSSFKKYISQIAQYLGVSTDYLLIEDYDIGSSSEKDNLFDEEQIINIDILTNIFKNIAVQNIEIKYIQIETILKLQSLNLLGLKKSNEYISDLSEQSKYTSDIKEESDRE